MKNLKIISLLVVLMVSSFLVFAENSVKIAVPKNGEVYFGAFPDFGGEENIVTRERIEAFQSLSQKKIAWAPFSQHWFKGMDYPKESIHTIHDMDIIPYVRFLPRSTLKQFEIEENFTLEKIINGNFDRELRLWAKEAKKDNIPIIMDFALEMNGNWFGWSGIFNGKDTKAGYGNVSHYDGAERYRDAYRHIIDIFREEDVNHITWFFHPTVMTTPKEAWNAPVHYYPGDDYIDWIGISLYGAFHPGENYWDSFREILSDNYRSILEISTKKPFAILELGVTDHHTLGSKDVWLKEAFDTILSQDYVHFDAITYWHENWDNNGILTSLRIDSSVKTLKSFRSAISNNKFISTVKIIEK